MGSEVGAVAGAGGWVEEGGGVKKKMRQIAASASRCQKILFEFYFSPLQRAKMEE